MSEIRGEIIKIVSEVADPGQSIASNTNESLYDLGLDSLDFSSVLMAVEDKYSLQFAEEDLDKVRSINDICHFIETKLSSKEPCCP